MEESNISPSVMRPEFSLDREPQEDIETFQLRKIYTENAYIHVKPPIQLETAKLLGLMIIKKIKYNIQYDPYTEKTLNYVNEQIRSGK